MRACLLQADGGDDTVVVCVGCVGGGQGHGGVAVVHGGVPALAGEGCAREEGQHGLWQGVAGQERKID